ncbi:hypothetical protein P5673_028329 [Acropora cervicornis]|uniref:Uncharacterized protein n=1 Tax=Acropora cervicornis TaxID=6130 RepID=A0AAD9PXP3_ACRCE|nr:hypothetical protein P5673_028329 [Acropora cervicornis]
MACPYPQSNYKFPTPPVINTQSVRLFTLSTGPWFRWLSAIEKLLLLAILFSESVCCLDALGIGHLTFISWWIRQPIGQFRILTVGLDLA